MNDMQLAGCRIVIVREYRPPNYIMTCYCETHDAYFEAYSAMPLPDQCDKLQSEIVHRMLLAALVELEKTNPSEAEAIRRRIRETAE